MIQPFYPGATVKLTIKDVCLNSPRSGKTREIYHHEAQEFIIVPTGVTDTSPEYTNHKLYIQFNSNTKKQDQ